MTVLETQYHAVTHRAMRYNIVILKLLHRGRKIDFGYGTCLTTRESFFRVYVADREFSGYKGRDRHFSKYPSFDKLPGKYLQFANRIILAHLQHEWVNEPIN